MTSSPDDQGAAPERTGAAPSAARRPGRPRTSGSRTPGTGSRTPAEPGTTKEAILEAARSSFLAKGFARTTIRGVARAAGVDPALVPYYFGTKGDLFAAALNLRIRASEEIAKVLADDVRTAGPRLVRLSMTAWDDSAGGATFRALLRWVATDDGAPQAIQDYAAEQLAAPLTEALGQAGIPTDVARERATLAATQLVGLAVVRYVFRLEPIASMSVDRLVELIGPTIQHYLTGPLTRRR